VGSPTRNGDYCLRREGEKSITLTIALLIAVTLTLAGAGPVVGGGGAIASGARVRVLAPAISAKPIVGQLVGSDETTLTILRTGGRPLVGWPFRRGDRKTLRLPRESVTRLERSVRPSRKALGKGVGMGVGLLAGVLAASRINPPSSTGQGAELLTMPLGVVVGGFLGAAVTPGDRWAAEDPGKVRVGFTRAPGVGVRLSVAF
jgi:hypothetical protein